MEDKNTIKHTKSKYREPSELTIKMGIERKRVERHNEDKELAEQIRDVWDDKN